MSADNWAVCPKCGQDFREDYDIGIDGDEFMISYRGECGNSRQKSCGLAIIYKIRKPVDGVKS